MKKVQFCQLVRKLSEVEGISPSSILRRLFIIIIIIIIVVVVIIIIIIFIIVVVIFIIIFIIVVVIIIIKMTVSSMKTSTDEGVDLDGSECGSGLTI